MALAGILATAAIVAGRAQDSPAQDGVEQRIAKLEQAVTAQKIELDRLVRIAAGLAAGAEKLATAVDQAEVKGFVQAGPNPAARTELLDGIKAFHEAVKLAMEPPRPPPDKK